MMRFSSTAATRRWLAGSLLAALAIVPLGTAPADAAGARRPSVDSCHLDRTVAQLTQYGDNKSNNVIVFAKSARKSAHFEGVIRHGSRQETGCDEVGPPFTDQKTYIWVVFSGKGTFVRQGDGGYRNWAFYGVWKRHGDKKVVFEKRR